MGTSREEEMFQQTQPLEKEEESDSIYIELAKAVTERKCRIVQKKEKCKLLLNQVIKMREQLKLAENERERQKMEKEDVCTQETLRVKNLENAQKSYSTLETTLIELNKQVALEKAETKRKKEEFDAAIKDGHDTWESYKEKYENFPLAKKLREITTAVRKIDITIKQANMDITDFKMKKKLKQDIAERKFYLSTIRIAEKFKIYESKVRESEVQQKKILEMENLYSDLKSGQATINLLRSPQGPTGSTLEKGLDAGFPQQKVMEFALPSLPVNSPPPPASDSSYRGLFNWDSLLTSAGLSEFRKTLVEKSTKALETTAGTKYQTNADSVLRTEYQKKEDILNTKNVDSSVRLTNLLMNSLVGQRRYGMEANRKRTTQNEANQQDASPCKLKMLVTPEDNKTCRTSNPGLQKSNSMKNENFHHSMLRKEQTKENYPEVTEKKNINPKISKTTVNKAYMPPLNRNKTKEVVTSKSTTQNLRNILSLQGISRKENKPGPPRTDDQQQKVIKNVPVNNKNISQLEQQKNYSEVEIPQNVNSDQQTQRFDNVPLLLEPGSPAPDLIPVETNSQPLSQGNVSQTCSPINFNLSGGSDIISPDVDDKTRKVYQEMLSQGPYPTLQHSNNENTTNVQNQELEGGETVRSKYFTEPESLGILPDGPGNYQHPGTAGQLYSPPYGGGEFDNSQFISPIPSPPSANIAAFGASVPTSTSSAFSFSSSPKRTNKSFFDLF